MYWNKIRPSGFGKAIDLIKICDYSMSFSGTDRISYDTLATITPDEGFVLPWTPDSQKTYQIICQNEQASGTVGVTSSNPEVDKITSIGCGMAGYVRLNKVAGGYTDISVGVVNGAAISNTGSISLSCGGTGEIDYAISSIQSRLVVPTILSGFAAPNTTVSRAVSLSGELWLVVY